MSEEQMVLQLEDGEEMLADILFTCEVKEFQKEYVVFLPVGSNECGAAVYHDNGDGSGSLSEIQTEAEWKLLEHLLEQYQAGLKKQ